MRTKVGENSKQKQVQGYSDEDDRREGGHGGNGPNINHTGRTTSPVENMVVAT